MNEGSGMQWEAIAPAKDDEEVRRRHAANQAGWNEAAERYAADLDASIARIKARESTVHPVEKRNLESLGPLSEWCERAVHLQCASGEDTLSLWLEGAKEVIGVDLSDVHVANAERLTAAVDAPARWICSDVLAAPEELDASADLVYTGRGAINWLHDLDAWARVVHRILKPGGVVHLYDDHPFLWLLDHEVNEPRFHGDADYFNAAEMVRGWPSSYLDGFEKTAAQQAPKYERYWPLQSVLQSLIDADLQILRFGEHPECYWDALPELDAELRGKLPLTFSVLAKKS